MLCNASWSVLLIMRSGLEEKGIPKIYQKGMGNMSGLLDVVLHAKCRLDQSRGGVSNTNTKHECSLMDPHGHYLVVHASLQTLRN